MSVVALDRVAGFQWDCGDARKSADKHAVSQSEAEQVFLNGPILSPDTMHSTIEPRFHALGMTDFGRKLHVSFTLREHATRIRVISARDMHRRERGIDEQNR